MQYSLFPEWGTQKLPMFPSTRYQGSKAKFVDWIWYELSKLNFHTVLDAFGGTGCVAYKLKNEGKKVTYNDILPFNSIIGKALIENDSIILDNKDIEYILTEHKTFNYPNFIENHFRDIYYTDTENHWLDVVRFNISLLNDEYKQALAWFALFQACIIKRPYNLFHRKNLYVRLSEVQRSFGNKKTWDTPFETHFRHFVEEANNAVFHNGVKCKSINQDALQIYQHYDLIYIDTPYLNDKGIGVDYADFYHFLNGMVDYENWKSRIDFHSKHLRLKKEYSIWNDKNNIINGFETLMLNFKDSILVFSYRSNGIPSIDDLTGLLREMGRDVDIKLSKKMKYALSDAITQEVLIISPPKD